MAAGDRPKWISGLCEDGVRPCVEIMTGAQFPIAIGTDDKFDACVRIEDTTFSVNTVTKTQCMTIVKPVMENQNRRLAGSDFQKGDLVIAAGSVVKPQHVMALASLGVSKVTVLRKARIAILCTGSELLSYESDEDCQDRIRDSNGPYIEAALQMVGVGVTYLGIVRDDGEEFDKLMQGQLDFGQYDVIITTGAVSMGKFDFVREAIERLGANVHFHKVAIRPGHPILFATLPAEREVAFFGLPGNPFASVACLRFFVMPYIGLLAHQPSEIPIQARLNAGHESIVSSGPCSAPRHNLKAPSHLTIFWHGVLRLGHNGPEAKIIQDQGSNKVKPLLGANSWISIPEGAKVMRDGDMVDCFPLYPGSLEVVT
ncbi:hypothetical protein MMC30_005160 [Trapelia coarctata]|nr:hypothetical protein [Trapelia coarctata]